MAHVANVHFSQCRATSMIKARDCCIRAFVLRWALLRPSDGSNLLSRPTKGSKGQRHRRRRRRHCSTVATDTTPTDA
jgi:hypothetical protein